MRILAVTSWGGACGIANYAQMLQEALGEVAPEMELVPWPEGLDPAQAPFGGFDWLWLNYHRGLHSRWTPESIREKGYNHTRVAITFHDTYGESAPDALAQQLHDLADAFVVHEPCEGLPKQILIRQGVPGPPWMHLYELDALAPWKQYPDQPILGTVGFNFPWKNFDRLAEVTAEAGWAYLVLSNNATEADEARWKAANPSTKVLSGFRPTEQLVSALAYADATAFPYECANSGTSGAIRLGLAARKPVLAFEACRQFRDLYLEPEGGTARDNRILWCRSFPDLAHRLQRVPIQRVDPAIVYLAERDAWTHQAARYAEVFRGRA